jgi:chaperonin cofactor prefoldin
LPTITRAESSALPREVKQQQTQTQELQIQLKDANSRISTLEATLSSANKVSNRVTNGHGH